MQARPLCELGKSVKLSEVADPRSSYLARLGESVSFGGPELHPAGICLPEAERQKPGRGSPC